MDILSLILDFLCCFIFGVSAIKLWKTNRKMAILDIVCSSIWGLSFIINLVRMFV